MLLCSATFLDFHWFGKAAFFSPKLIRYIYKIERPTTFSKARGVATRKSRAFIFLFYIDRWCFRLWFRGAVILQRRWFCFPATCGFWLEHESSNCFAWAPQGSFNMGDHWSLQHEKYKIRSTHPLHLFSLSCWLYLNLIFSFYKDLPCSLSHCCDQKSWVGLWIGFVGWSFPQGQM